MNRLLFALLLFLVVISAQATPVHHLSPMVAPTFASEIDADLSSGAVSIPPRLVPSLTPDEALAIYQKKASSQWQALAGYSASTLIRAELPGSSQHGEFELERRFTAPHSLAFKPLRYVGDAFVKTNIIARILQSEVDHLEKGDPSSTAMRDVNYKFSYKNLSQIDGRAVYMYQVKPHKKRVGLIKGQIYLDATSGSLVRIEGRVVKSPSLFVKKIDFTQDFADVSGFTLPVHMHSEAKASLIGRTIVDIENRDYQPVTSVENAAVASGSF